MKFYVAEGNTREKLLELDKARSLVMKSRQKFVGRFKGKGSISQGSSMIGIVFAKGAPPPWVYSRKLSDTVPSTHVPDRSAEGKKVKAEMESLADPAGGFAVAEILKVQPFFFGTYAPARFAVYSRKVIVALDDRSDAPANCTRISDLDYERFVTLAKAAALRRRKR